MGMSLSLRNTRREQGFSLIETVVAIAVLSVGLMSMAALMARMMSTTNRAGYMSIAMQLASEKLEDLNRFPPNDPNVTVSTGTTAGSLSADLVTSAVTSDGESHSVNYWDQVWFSATGGAVKEIKSKIVGGITKYDVSTHQPDGTVSWQHDQTALPSPSGMMRFKRRWLIEKDQPTTGVRRATVLVTLQNPVNTPVTAQMSMVRP